jgi:LacI family transcriptional regulator
LIGLAAELRPTAIFAANDSMAIGALSALREAGVPVPEEVAVAGFDDIPIAQYTSPPLTSVRVPIIELGERATTRLVRALATDGPRRPRRETLSTELVVRQSCGGKSAYDQGTPGRKPRAPTLQEAGT